MSESIIFTCPSCNTRLKINPEKEITSKQARCPSCQKWIKLPVIKKEKAS